MSPLRISRLTSSSRDKFNRLVVEKHPHSVLQSWEWGELKAGFGWQAHRLLVERDGDELALTVLERKMPLLPRSILYSPHCSLIGEDITEAVSEYLRDEFPRGVVWKVEPVEGVEAEYLRGLGFREGSRVQPKTTLQLDLTESQEGLSAHLERKTRYNVGLAGRRGVEVRQQRGEEGYRVFIELLLETSKRKGFLIHAEPYYRHMYELFVKDGPGMILNSYYEGEVTACAFILRFGSYAYYVLGASSPRHSRHKSSQLLQWRAILWAKEDGAQVYDFWGVPQNPSPKSHLWGVYNFKKGFGGRIVHRSGAYDLVLREWSYGLWKTMLGVYNGIRNFRARGSFRDPLED